MTDHPVPQPIFVPARATRRVSEADVDASIVGRDGPHVFHCECGKHFIGFIDPMCVTLREMYPRRVQAAEGL